MRERERESVSQANLSKDEMEQPLVHSDGREQGALIKKRVS